MPQIQEIFLVALEIEDLRQRTVYVAEACGDDKVLHRKIQDLLAAHERSGEFLDVPVMQQLVGAQTQGGREAHTQELQEEIDLSFLQPSSRPGALGRLLHYEVLEVVGRGGCGIVWKAFDEKLHRVVAIKTMAPELAATSPARKRFLREARATAAVRHENVVHVYAVEEKPLPFLVMEFINGQTLQDKINETGPLDIQNVVSIGRQVARGLAAAHALGLIHRDIKPANILLENGTGRPRITDFGLVRSTDDASLTQSGYISGTPLYMSPEQAQGLEVDQRSDLFSLGSVLYVMCSGRPPFRASTTIGVLKRVVEEQPRPIREVIPEVPLWLVTVIAKLHAKKPKERFSSAEEVAHQLTHFQVDDSHTTKIVVAPPFTSLRRSNSLGGWMKVIALILMVLSGLGAAEATGITNLQDTVFRFFSSEGTLVVEVDDPNIRVSIEIDGEAMVMSGARIKEIRLKPGQYQLRAEKDGENLRQEFITITKDGRRVVRVSREDFANTASAKPVFQELEKTLWQGPNDISLFFVEQKGETFLARLTIGNSIDREVHGVVKGQSLSWLAQDVIVIKGGTGANNYGTISTDTLGDRMDFTYRLDGPEKDPPGMSGSFTLRRKKVEVLSDPDRLAAEYVLSVGGTVQVDGFAKDIKLPQELPAQPFHLTTVKLHHHQNVKETDLKVFAETTHIQFLELSGMSQISDASLAFFKNNRLLTNLHLAFTPVTGTGFNALRDCSSLRVLWLNSAAISDEGLSAIARMKELSLLGLIDCQISDRGMAHFANHPNLRQVELPGTKITDETLKTALTWPKLGRLHVDRTEITDQGLAILKSCRTLDELAFSGTRISDTGIQELAHLLSLKKLNLVRTQASETGVRNLSGILRNCRIAWNGGIIEPSSNADFLAASYVFSVNGTIQVDREDGVIRSASRFPSGPFQITTVNLKACPKASDEGLSVFDDCIGVVALDISETSIHNRGLEYFRKCRHLKSLICDNSNVIGPVLGNFEECQYLEELGLYNVPFHLNDLLPIADRHYRHLNLGSTAITDDWLSHFTNVDDVEFLNLCYTEIGDKGLAHFQQCHKLKSLSLGRTKITDVGLAYFQDCLDLEDLILSETAITDKSLKTLKNYKNLKSLQLLKTNISANGIENLKQSLPQCCIIWDGGVIEPAKP